MTCLDETTAAALLAGELPTAEAEAAREHLVTCRDCEQFVAELARVEVDAIATTGMATPVPATQLASGTTVGRYKIVERIGAGGMGIVYLATDPELDRKVAIKLLRGEVSEEARARLLREAQSAARVAHPNVVAIYDIGTFERGVYLAMEYVEGETLAGWLQAPHTWQQIVDAFVQCGRGLAAAHAKGVIHRDFKPDNVLVGLDGRIRVVDFGLAREAAGTPTPGDAQATSKLTQTGALIGTPRFMAPEQFTGGQVTHATDQFALCVALYAALYRTPPFRGDRVSEIADRVVAGDLAPPVDTRGPAALRRAIVRGLSGDPERRHPTMDALVRELERALKRRRDRAIAAGAVCLSAALVVGLVLPRASDAPCANSAEHASAVWNPERAARVQAALASDPMILLAVESRIDEYAQAWSSARVAACTATHVEKDQSQQLLDRRVACLDDRLGELNAFVTELEKADRAAIRRSIQAADALPSLAMCADRKALAERVPPPDPAIAVRVAEIATQLARAEALQRLGKVAPALELANAACATIPDHAPLLARCRFVVASLVDQAAGDNARAIDLMTEAVHAATAANDQERVAKAALALARLLGDRMARFDEAKRWLDLADAASKRLADRRDVAWRIAHVRGLLAARQGKHDEALPHFEEELRIVQDLDPKGGLPTADALVAMGHALLFVGRADEAEAHYRDGLVIVEEVAGQEHPSLLPILDGLGNLGFMRRDFAAAIPHLERSLAITRTMVGPRHSSTILAQTNLGAALTQAKQLDRALVELEEARRNVAEADRRVLGQVLSNLVPVYQKRRDYARAHEIAEQALAAEREVKGEEHVETGIAYFNLGDVLINLKRPRDAEPNVQKALAIFEKALPPDHPHVALARDVLAEIKSK